MNNDELKKKIVEVLKPVIRAGNISCNEENACKKCWFPCEIERTAGRLADALIAAGIGDVSSEKAMRELAEAFYREKCAEYDLLNYQMQKSEYRIAEAEHRAEVAELVVKNLNDIFTFDYQTVFEQAEKELEEENNAKN